MTGSPSTLTREATSTQASGRTRMTQTRGTTVIAMRGVSVWHRISHRVVQAWHRVRGVVRPGGWLALIAATVGLGVGIRFGIAELVAAGVLAGVLLLLALPFLLRARPYEVDFELAHDRVVAGSSARARITVRNDAVAVALPGTVDIPVGAGLIDIAVPLLRRGTSHEEAVEIPAPRRGVVTIGPISSVRGDPLGLLRREATWAQTHTLYIHPRTTSIPPTSAGFIRDLDGRPSPVLVDADISFHAIREYVPGDAQRHVHWKSTAKTGTLMVRQYEQSRRSRMVIAIDTDHHSFRDDEEFELAVSVAASLGIRGVRDGRNVQVVVGEEIPEFARSRVRSIRDLPTMTERILMDALAGIESHDAVNPLAEVAALAVEAHSDVSLAFLVGGSTMTAAALQRAALAFPPHVGVAAVICDLEGEPRLRRLGEATVISIGVLDDLRQILLRGAQS